jgi:rhodanese-related sulfurtransferase
MMTTVRVRRGFWLVAVLSLAGVFAGCGNRVDDRDIRLIQASEVKLLLDRSGAEPGALLVIDPRPPARFDEGHLPGARQMALPPLEAGGNDPALTSYGALVVSGENPADPLGSAMAKRLMQLRYKGVRLFAGGLEEWRRLGYPVETGAR